MWVYIYNDIFDGYGSEIKKDIKSQLENAMKIDLDLGNVSQLNPMFADHINEYIKGILREHTIQPTIKLVDSLLVNDKEFGDSGLNVVDIESLGTHLTDIIYDDIMNEDDHSIGEKDGESYSIYAEFNSKAYTVTMYIDEALDTPQNCCDIECTISVATGTIIDLKKNDERMTKRRRRHDSNGVDKALICMYNNQVKMNGIFDEVKEFIDTEKILRKEGEESEGIYELEDQWGKFEAH